MTREPETFTEEELHAYADGHLDPARRAALEADAEAVARARAYRRQNEALHGLFDSVAEEPPPARFSVDGIQDKLTAGRRRAWLRLAASVAIFLIGGLAGWALNDGLSSRGAVTGSLAREALTAHRLYVSEVRHPVEVAADQEAHLVAWLSKRLGAPLKIPVLARAGYSLVGGRLLPSSLGPAAQFMYERADGRRLTVFIRSNPSSDTTAFRYLEEGGVSAFYWLDGPLGYALIGEEERERLLDLSRAIYQQLNS
jgi:anti-sigma factor RsiW